MRENRQKTPGRKGSFVPLREMMSGVRASSIKIESASSTTQKLYGRCTTFSIDSAKLSRRKSNPSSWLDTYVTSQA